ncbi:MAG: hypothetical protein KatS3mg002_1038 [Candidatus Woesearchaeota archaeon]|nr:MAG: hypothetical protein KatS3mg002_1038 [Candidatus Woesearchaeota archaeon]
MGYITFETVNSLKEIFFIGGTTYTLKFICLDSNNNPINLSSATCYWGLSPYGTDFPLITKTGSIVNTNTFEVYLSNTDTKNLSGKYTHQPKIVFPNNVVVIPAQGIITIVKGI